MSTRPCALPFHAARRLSAESLRARTCGEEAASRDSVRRSIVRRGIRAGPHSAAGRCRARAARAPLLPARTCAAAAAATLRRCSLLVSGTGGPGAAAGEA